jgi:hypothetical protein
MKANAALVRIRIRMRVRMRVRVSPPALPEIPTSEQP